jgi:hypothetical protein
MSGLMKSKKCLLFLLIFAIENGNVDGEDVYAAFGQAESGRYLIVFFV